ncbi:DNA-directed RNA polymerase subunit delta [Amphibacillus sediminis]|uniref:DNA-directed RNA polymerase subunit delta n=1 Tax=Amphibacillus sediminis TaxID=360185 RepID=UPI00082D3132|nr:DNA-directed RNA polymerase subunit delta [Amphibacillus sediminis]
MSSVKLNHDNLHDLSMIELAIIILEHEKKALNYQDLFDKVAELKRFSSADKEAFIAQFYTDLNIDGRFLTLGSGLWGLKVWYPVEQIDEEITTERKKKKKKKKKSTSKVLEDAIDPSEDLTEVPLDFVEAGFDDEDEEDIDLAADDLIDDDLDDVFEDDDYEDEYEDDEDVYDEDEDDVEEEDQEEQK